MSPGRLDLKATAHSLRDVQRAFPKINEGLQTHQDSMTGEVVGNLMAGYTFDDKAIAENRHLLMPRHIMCLLELNHLVLCGCNPRLRKEYKTHIDTTTRRFHEQKGGSIDDIVRWYLKHRNESPWKLVADVYVRILSQP